MDNKYKISVFQPIQNEYKINFVCDDEDFMNKFNAILSEFYLSHNGKITFEKSK